MTGSIIDLLIRDRETPLSLRDTSPFPQAVNCESGNPENNHDSQTTLVAGVDKPGCPLDAPIRVHLRIFDKAKKHITKFSCTLLS